jgi:hypothetical protein
VRLVLNQWQGSRAQLGGLSERDRADRDLCKQGTRATRRLGAVGKQVQFLVTQYGGITGVTQGTTEIIKPAISDGMPV